MIYVLESNYDLDTDRMPLLSCQDGWRPFGGLYQRRDVEDLAAAKRCLKRNSDLARLIWPMRVVDTEGRVYGYYDPQQDMRLPGCRWRATQRRAYHLWEAAGKPVSDGQDFWYQAEQQVVEEDNEGFVWLGEIENERD